MPESTKRTLRLIRGVRKFCDKGCNLLVIGDRNYDLTYPLLHDMRSCRTLSLNAIPPRQYERLLVLNTIQFMGLASQVNLSIFRDMIFKGSMLITVVPNMWWPGGSQGLSFSRREITSLFESQGFDVTQCDFIGAPMFSRDEVTNRFKAKELLVVARKNTGQWDHSLIEIPQTA